MVGRRTLFWGRQRHTGISPQEAEKQHKWHTVGLDFGRGTVRARVRTEYPGGVCTPREDARSTEKPGGGRPRRASRTPGPC